MKISYPTLESIVFVTCIIVYAILLSACSVPIRFQAYPAEFDKDGIGVVTVPKNIAADDYVLKGFWVCEPPYNRLLGLIPQRPCYFVEEREDSE